jgi:hypothetical protein
MPGSAIAAEPWALQAPVSSVVRIKGTEFNLTAAHDAWCWGIDSVTKKRF